MAEKIKLYKSPSAEFTDWFTLVDTVKLIDSKSLPIWVDLQRLSELPGVGMRRNLARKILSLDIPRNKYVVRHVVYIYLVGIASFTSNLILSRGRNLGRLISERGLTQYLRCKILSPQSIYENVRFLPARQNIKAGREQLSNKAGRKELSLPPNWYIALGISDSELVGQAMVNALLTGQCSLDLWVSVLLSWKLGYLDRFITPSMSKTIENLIEDEQTYAKDSLWL